MIHQLILDKRLSRGPDKYITVDLYELKACFPHIKIDEFVAATKDDPFENAEREWKERRRNFTENQDACDTKVLELHELLKKYAGSMASRGIDFRLVDAPNVRAFSEGAVADSTILVLVRFPQVLASRPMLPIGFGGHGKKFHLVDIDQLRQGSETISSQFGYEFGLTAEECVDAIARIRVSLEPELKAAKEAAKEAAARRERELADEAAKKKQADQERSRAKSASLRQHALRTAMLLGVFMACYLRLKYLVNNTPNIGSVELQFLVINLVWIASGIFGVGSLLLLILRLLFLEKDMKNN